MRKLVSGLLLFAIYLSSFLPFVSITNAQNIAKVRENRMKDLEPGLKFRLSEGVQGAETREKQPPANTDPLSEDDSSNIIKRLPQIKSGPDDQTDFARRIGTLPAPKTGKQIPVKFPSDEGRGTPKISPETSLEVIRFSPEGEVPLAPDLSVTFSQPMVAVTSQDEAAKYAPVELSPQVEGRWRWLGTKTLMFDTTKRFPMATKFTARVPAGTKSATGQALQKDIIWTFTTPPPKAEQFVPQGQTVRRDEIMFLSFDQEINPEAVLKTISVTGQGRKLPLRLATQQEVDGSSISYYAKQAQPKRWVAFRVINSDGSVENALPPASSITVTVEKGTPSAEGPLTTIKAQSYSFQTYGPMKFSGGYCGYRNIKNCSPFEGWHMEFNNSIDSSKFTKEMVRIEPAVEGLNVFPSGNHIYIQGYKKGRASYKVTVDGTLQDIFGQSLGQPAIATIKVGSAEQSLYAQGGSMVVLDPTAKPSYSIYSTNHNSVKVRMYDAEPQDWHQFTQYVQRINYDDGKRPAIPGRLISDKFVAIQSKPDEMVETRIDIAPALNGGFGNVIVDIQPIEDSSKIVTVRYRYPRVFTWLQATQIGLDAFVDNQELIGFTTELKSGIPISGVDMTIFPNGSSVGSGQLSVVSEEKGIIAQAWDWLTGAGGPNAGDTESLNADGSAAGTETIGEALTNQSAANGILRLSLPEESANQQNLLIAKKGKDVAFLPEQTDIYWQGSGSWHKKTLLDKLRWFTFDDRKMYRPKEEVAVKGYIRKITAGKLGDVEPLGETRGSIDYSVQDSRENEIAKGTTAINAFGAFDFKFVLADNANLRDANVEFYLDRSESDTADYTHHFQIQEFRRPEFEVSTKVETEAPHFVGANAELSVEAKYYSGGGLANADANWTVTATPTNYTPPNRGDFTFGTWVPWWRVYDHGDYGYGDYGGTTQDFKGVTDATGKHLLKIDFESVNPPRPYSVQASASVQDVNRQTWSSSTVLLVHPSSLYVGIKTPRTFVQKGEKMEIESIVSDIDGKLIAGSDVEIKAVLKDWRFDKGAWKEEIIDEQNCTVKSVALSEPGAVATGPAKCTFIAKQGGRYTVTATVMDDRERFNESEFTIWVPGGKMPPKRNVEQEEVQIIPSRKDYAPDEVAELLVIAPFTPAEGVLTLRREGIVKTERFSMKDSSITLKIPLDEKYLPNIYAQVDLVGAAERNAEGSADIEGSTDTLVRNEGRFGPNNPLVSSPEEPAIADRSVRVPKRPAFASGNINLAISTEERKLTVSAEPRDKTLAPGSETKVDVSVKDSRGAPVADSEVAVVIVDESVLALSGYSIADPMGIFYMDRSTGTTDYHSRKNILLGNPEDVKKQPPPPTTGWGDPNASAIEMSVDVLSSRQIQNLPMMARGAKSELRANSYKLADKDEKSAQINLRENFNALAVFSPSVKTDSNGKATVDVKLPDNLTRYRITAVSVDTGKRFGKSESAITAKQPLMVRPSAPRFMNFGDKIELPVVVQNQTDKDMTVDVAILATNAELTGGNLSGSEGVSSSPTGNDTLPTGRVSALGKRVVVKANSREEVRFPVSAVKAGTARFQIAANSGTYNDAAEISLPVWTPATTEAFATYGTTDADGAIIQPVQTPGDVYPQFGGLEVTTSSTQLQELTDAFIYLTNYPYACSEQISSRMISTAALRDVLQAFKAKDTPTAAQLEEQFKRDIQILQSRQRDDGSFGLWKRDKERYEYPFLTIHVAHALALAKAKGYKVPDEMLNKTKPYLKDIEKHFDDEWYKNAPQVRWTISAYALYIRDLMGDKDVAKTKKLLTEATIEKMPFEGLGWVLSVLANDPNSIVEVEAITRFLMNRITETAATANFVTDYGDGGWLIMYSNRRADGVLLEALIKAGDGSRTLLSAMDAERSPSSPEEPAIEDKSVRAPNDLIPKLVRGFLAHRTKGHWGSTQENVFILLALDKYFNAFEKVTPDFVTRIWLGNTYAGEETFKGRSVDSNVLNIPMSYLADQGGGNADTLVRNSSNLILDKHGAGRLYYRIGMKYAPKNLKLAPADYGFTVLRKYEALDNAEDVKQNADGSWTVKSGARVRVRLTMVAQARRYHVALVDNLPAGLEILNPELATTEAIPEDPGSNTPVIEYGSRSYGRGYWWYRQNWFEHQNFRDERAEAFASLLWEGVYNYTYVARATTPGEFVVPPAKAEEMYHAETFGRTGTDFVKVE